VLAGVNIEVLSPDIRKENESESVVGIANDGRPTDVELPVVIPMEVGRTTVLFGVYTEVLSPDIPRENEFGKVNGGIETDVIFPTLVVREEVGWAAVTEGEYVTVPWPDMPKENEFENVGIVNDEMSSDVTLPIVELREVEWATVLFDDDASEIVVVESVRDETSRGDGDWVDTPIETVVGRSGREELVVETWVLDPIETPTDGAENEELVREVDWDADPSEVVNGGRERDGLITELEVWVGELDTSEREKGAVLGEEGIWVGDPSDSVKEGREKGEPLGEVGIWVGSPSEAVLGEAENEELPADVDWNGDPSATVVGRSDKAVHDEFADPSEAVNSGTEEEKLVVGNWVGEPSESVRGGSKRELVVDVVDIRDVPVITLTVVGLAKIPLDSTVDTEELGDSWVDLILGDWDEARVEIAGDSAVGWLIPAILDKEGENIEDGCWTVLWVWAKG
jgi:hypothetical protein